MVANIWIAASDNNIKVVEDYLNAGQNANTKDPNGYTPVHAAASYGHLPLLKLLIQKGGDVNIQDVDGDTPLHHCEDLETAKYMVEQLKCDWTIKNHEGQTALECKEEEDEFPDLIAYLKQVMCGAEEPAEAGGEYGLPEAGNVDGREIKYSLEPETSELVDEERRQQIEAIMQGEDSEQKLREYVTNAVHEGMASWEEEKDTKKRKN